jgi:3-oxoadipate enol-lactonase
MTTFPGPAPVELAYRLDGPEDAPAVLLAPSLGTTWEVWDRLAGDLASTYQVVRFDIRGHGRSPVPPGPYSVEALATDVVALADALDLERFAFVGLSLGGSIGQVLVSTYGERLTAALLCCTVPRFGDEATWRERAATVRADGMAALAEATRERWFTDEFRAAHPDEVDRIIGMLTRTDPEGYAACCDALAPFDAWSRLRAVDVPVRVVAASEDPVAVPATCREMADTIPGADLVLIHGTSHLASAGRPDEFRDAVTEHLAKHL